jgi:hypothetical protein
MSLIAGKVLLSFVALVTSSGPYFFDWSKSLVFNPKWPPHAKYHNGQTMSFGLALGLATLWYLWGPVAGNYVRRICSSYFQVVKLFPSTGNETCGINTGALLTSFYSYLL